MRNEDIETDFVKAFVHRSQQDRCILQLSASKKRRDFLDTLCHKYEKVFDDRFMQKIADADAKPGTLLTLLQKHGAPDTCYAISESREIDGRSLPLAEALETCVDHGFPTILSCIPGRLAYFEAELVRGGAPRYLLKRT